MPPMRCAFGIPATVVICSTLAAQPTFGEPAPLLPVPGAAALAAARTGALAALADALRLTPGSNVWQAQHQLQQAARSAADPAVRYLLLAEAVGTAERAGDATAARNGILELARTFAVDADELTLPLLLRMHAGGPQAQVGAALVALELARGAMFAADETTMLRWYDAALRAAQLGADAPLYDFVRERAAWLRGWHAAWRDVIGDHDFDGRLSLASDLGALAGGVPNAAATAHDLAPLFAAVPDDLAARPWARLDAEGLVALAGRARSPVVCEGLLRVAVARLADGWNVLDDAERGRRCEAIVALTTRLATARGVHRLAFRADADLDQLVVSNGDWRVRDGVLVGSCTGTDNYATHRLAFRAIRTVVVRGGIRSAAGLNFRCKVGDVNLLLNWEVEPENHLWYLGQRTAKGPPALQAGREHCIVFVASPHDGVHVCIDGVRWWTAPGSLAGTVTIYPALGSEIFVREILVDGEPTGLVSGPSGTMM